MEMYRKTVLGLVSLIFFIYSSEASMTVYGTSCLEDGVTINLSSANVTSLQGSGSDLLVLHPNFTYEEGAPECTSSLTAHAFNVQLGQCDPFIEVTTECISFTWTVRVLKAATEPVSRFNDACFNVTCKFNRTYLLSSAKITPDVRKRVLTAVSKTANFNLSLTLYNDTTFQNQIPAGSSIIVNRLFYAQVSMNNVDFAPARYIVQITQCWATTTIASDSTPSYSLITSSCSANSYITIMRNYQNQTGSFSVSSFAWVTNNSLPVYVHCLVKVCDSSAPSANCSGPTCPVSSRRRRAIDSSDQQIFSYGPINLTPADPTPSCLENNGGCSDTCTIENNEIVCSCPYGSAIHENGKTCIDEGITLQIINSGNVEYYSTIVVGLLLLNFCVLMALIYTVRQRSLKTIV